MLSVGNLKPVVSSDFASDLVSLEASAETRNVTLNGSLFTFSNRNLFLVSKSTCSVLSFFEGQAASVCLRYIRQENINGKIERLPSLLPPFVH